MAVSLRRTIVAIVRAGGAYLVFSGIARVVPFALLPVLTRYIDPAGYGAIAVVMITSTALMPLIGLCSNSVFFQRYFKMVETERVYLLNDSYKIVALMSVAVMLLAAACEPLIRSYLKITLGAFELAVGCAAAGMAMTLNLTMFQIRKQPLYYGVFQTTNAVANMALTVVLVVVLGFSWEGRIWAMFASSLGLAIAGFYLNVRNGDVRLALMRHSPQLPVVARLGGALLPATFSAWAIAMSDRVFLTSLTSLEVLGIYAVGVMIGQVTDLVLNSLGQAYLPYFYEHAHRREQATRIRVVQATYAIVGVALVVAAGVSIVGPFILLWIVDVRYAGAAPVIGWIAFSYAFWCIGSVFQSLLLAVEKNAVTSYISTATLVVNLLANWHLIQAYGMLGAAMANAASSLTYVVLLFAAACYFNPMPWVDPRVIKLPR